MVFYCPICQKNHSNDKQIEPYKCIHPLCNLCYDIWKTKNNGHKCPVCRAEKNERNSNQSNYIKHTVSLFGGILNIHWYT